MKTNTNTIHLIGTLISQFSIHHEHHNEKFYSNILSVKRQSGTEDKLIIIISESKLTSLQNYFDKDRVEIQGQIRTYNNKDDDASSVLMYVYAQEIIPTDNTIDTNEFTLTGYLCKEPLYRVTIKGREITNLLLAVNRDFSKVSYLPAIAWGMYAKKSAKYMVGSEVICSGRLQSRNYTKIINDQETQNTTYELSLIYIILV